MRQLHCHFCGRPLSHSCVFSEEGEWYLDHSKHCPNPPKTFWQWLSTETQGQACDFVLALWDSMKSFGNFIVWLIRLIPELRKIKSRGALMGIGSAGTFFLIMAPVWIGNYLGWSQVQRTTAILCMALVWVTLFLSLFLYAEYETHWKAGSHINTPEKEKI